MLPVFGVTESLRVAPSPRVFNPAAAVMQAVGVAELRGEPAGHGVDGRLLARLLESCAGREPDSPDATVPANGTALETGDGLTDKPRTPTPAAGHQCGAAPGGRSGCREDRAERYPLIAPEACWHRNRQPCGEPPPAHATPQSRPPAVVNSYRSYVKLSQFNNFS